MAAAMAITESGIYGIKFKWCNLKTKIYMYMYAICKSTAGIQTSSVILQNAKFTVINKLSYNTFLP